MKTNITFCAHLWNNSHVSPLNIYWREEHFEQIL
jgi:hypothetical protein